MPPKSGSLSARARPGRKTVPSSTGKTALVLAGGGLTGGIYQVGALRALDDILLNRSTLDFDMYVGTSAGAFVATLLSVGIPPRVIAEAARNPSLNLQWWLVRHVFSPNLGEVGSRMLRLPRRLPAILGEFVRHRGNFLLSDVFALISLVVPTALLDSRQLGAFMRELLEEADLPTEFSQLQRELYVVACNVDTWERVVFSRDTQPAVAIPDAVAASAAIPLVFRPVHINGAEYIDGGVKGTAAIDVAIDRGAKLVVVVNALVPLDVRGIRRSTYLHRFGNSIVDLGIRGISNQLARGVIHDGLIDHIRLLRQSHPDVDIVLIEPRPTDEKMFFHEVMSTSARLVVAQHGYESVLEGLGQNYRHFADVLSRHGVGLSRHLLEGKPWVVPVKSVETGELPEQVQRTLFHPGRSGRRGRDRRSRRSERVESVVKRMERKLERGERLEAIEDRSRPRRARPPAASRSGKAAAVPVRRERERRRQAS